MFRPASAPVSSDLLQDIECSFNVVSDGGGVDLAAALRAEAICGAQKTANASAALSTVKRTLIIDADPGTKKKRVRKGRADFSAGPPVYPRARSSV